MNVTLLNDIVFNIVFGTQKNTTLLAALLNALLRLNGEDRIVDLTILNPHNEKAHLGDRGVILDVKSRDGRGRYYNIEVQVTDQPHYVNRSLYYLALLYGQQLHRGEGYDKLTRSIAISLVDYVLFPDIDDLHSTFRFYDVVHGRELSDVLEIHFIELVKFKQDRPLALRTPFEKWLHVLRFGDLYETEAATLPESLKEEEGIAMALNEMRRAYADDEVRELIAARKKAEHDEATRMNWARDEGEAKGEAKGKAEGKAEIARNMLAAGMESDQIFKLTGVRPQDQLP